MTRNSILGTLRRHGRLTLPTFSYAGLLTARVFKQDDRWDVLPIDVTVVFALLVVWFSVTAAIRNPDMLRSKSRELLMVIALFAALAFGLLDVGNSAYADQKVLGIYSFALIAALAPFLLIRSSEERRTFFNAIIVLAIVLGIETLILTVTGFTAEQGRVRAFGGVPIWSARLAGAGLLILTVGLLFRRVSKLVVLGTAVVLGVGMAASGSRGPLLGLIVALVVVASWAWNRSPYLRTALRATLPLVAVVVLVVSTAVPKEATERLFYVFDDGVRGSELERFEYYGAAIDGISRHPIGAGWGAFDEVVRGYDLSVLNESQIEDVYPHNIFLEVTVEAGWVAGVTLVAVLLAVFRRILRAEVSEDGFVVLALLVFYVVNASLSGDINANRWVPALIGIVLAGFGPPLIGRRRRRFVPGVTPRRI